MVSIGENPHGVGVFGPSRPTLHGLSRAMAIARREDASADMGSVLSAPEGWSFPVRGDGSVVCNVPGTSAVRFRRAYGYIGAACYEPKILRINYLSNLFMVWEIRALRFNLPSCSASPFSSGLKTPLRGFGCAPGLLRSCVLSHPTRCRLRSATPVVMADFILFWFVGKSPYPWCLWDHGMRGLGRTV